MRYPWALDFWNSGEWQVVNERLQELEKRGLGFNPTRDRLFEALRCTPEKDVRVCIMGQDPYPNAGYATGLAFSIPESFGQSFPPTLKTFFDEYQSDLQLPCPSHGNLERWAREEGVLLWNAIPSCRTGVSLSHDWPGQEWDNLTREIVRRLADRGICFAFLGGVARRFAKDIDTSKNRVIETSHPSPRGMMNSKVPFIGSRLFSTINGNLNDLGLEPVSWRLKDEEYDPSRGSSSPGIPRDPHLRKSGKVLPNEGGIKIGGLQNP